jgi:hypothetical protein
MNIDDVITIGIRVLSNGSNVLLENEKIDKSIKSNEWKLNDVTLSTFVVIVIYVLAIIDEDLGTYITPLHKEIRCGNNEKE